ncbi:MAG: ATP-binding protein [Kofleriaceae bacterium]
MVDAQLHLIISSELCQVRFLSAAVRAVLGELSYPSERISAVELCLVEAVNNVIEHAYREEAGHSVALRIQASAARVEVVVSDAGISMPEESLAHARARQRELAGQESLSLAEVELDSIAEGGYGLGLIIELMDQVTYHRDNGRNFLTMSLQVDLDQAAGESVGAASPPAPEPAVPIPPTSS